MMKYYMKNNGQGPYVEGEDVDVLWDPATCMEVPKRPSYLHKWNKISKKWELAIEDKRNDIRNIRNMELLRTDKFMIFDFPIIEGNKTIALNYRQQLRDLPAKQTIEELKMPAVPEFMN